ncbi:glycoside hydrolase family 2 TIM barrel-domain containing protein [Danxiaibacter flavus]|uniref:Glycoside hydrolase family 2 TIM barrel-domain containing protein n=1 Tax=Danxiaibacter flavus TaxID=3049108 RepID=A0ABV3ZAK0_9BACT|nr:glycoside hydrolase family 2 TIM barrel-domain containing protein [Chitinophagaceae bacterium DXS]
MRHYFLLSRILLIVLCTLNFVSSFGQVNNSENRFSQNENSAARKVLNFNANWAFYRGDLQHAEAIDFNDKDWYAISVPHVLRLEKKHNGGNEVYQGVGWYRKYFVVPASFKNKRLTICFDGVQMNCDVFLNGEKIYTHYGGYMGFVVDVTNKIKFDRDNVLALRVTNENDPQTPPGRNQEKLDFNYYGGIYRDVKLVATNKLYISDPLEAGKIAGGGLFVTYPKVSRQYAEVNVKTHIVNEVREQKEVKLVTVIKDNTNREVARAVSANVFQDEKEFVQTLAVNNPSLWHPDHPYLYHLVSQVYSDNKLVDEKTTSIGIRTISFKSPSGKADGFYINGEKLYLRGANRHQCYQTIGDAASNSMQYRDALQIKKGGFNSVRAAHYPQSPAFLNACDELGLLVIECEPGWQFFNKDSIFICRTFRDIREMIRRDRNRPSVFLWETSLNESPTPAAWAKQAVAIAHEEMPNDQMFTSDDFFANGKKFYDVCYKVVNEDGSDPMPQMPSITREWGDTWIADPAKENGLRASRMYTEKGLINQCILRQNALNGTPLESEGGYWDHAKLDANERIAGYFLWSFNDVTRGSDPITAFCGVVDIDRYEKFGYYQLKAMQDARNPAYGPMVFIASFNNRPDIDSSVIVFSNCEKVKFYRNNHFIKEITRSENAVTAPFIAAKGGSPYFKFDLTTYETGELKAEGYLDGKLVAVHTIATPGKPDHLEIEVDDQLIKPVGDGTDMIPLHVKICDKNGTLISNKNALESYTIHLNVSGAGSLIGADIARANIAVQHTEGGIGYGIIRTGSHAGKITVSATADALRPAQKVVTTVKSEDQFVQDGKHYAWLIEKENTVLKEGNMSEALNEKTQLIKLLPSMLKVNSEKLLPGIEKLIDEDYSTVWIDEANIVPAELTIDLGGQYKLKGCKIVWGKDSDWYTYSLQVSEDGKNWKTEVENVKSSGQEYKPVLFTTTNARYVRLKIAGVQSEQSKIAVKEFELVGSDDN